MKEQVEKKSAFVTKSEIKAINYQNVSQKLLFCLFNDSFHAFYLFSFN
ncbi:hypothetical protein JN06_01724 [Bacteroides zoogleoformans]|nr:hypothetical protein JN06_01724 [Bacteroides zoogleoformans]